MVRKYKTQQHPGEFSGVLFVRLKRRDFAAAAADGTFFGSVRAVVAKVSAKTAGPFAAGTESAAFTVAESAVAFVHGDSS